MGCKLRRVTGTKLACRILRISLKKTMYFTLNIKQPMGFTTAYSTKTIWWMATLWRLQAHTSPDRYPISHIQDFNHFLKDATIFSVLIS